jgi:hypothetical protein
MAMRLATARFPPDVQETSERMADWDAEAACATGGVIAGRFERRVKAD